MQGHPGGQGLGPELDHGDFIGGEVGKCQFYGNHPRGIEMRMSGESVLDSNPTRGHLVQQIQGCRGHKHWLTNFWSRFLLRWSCGGQKTSERWSQGWCWHTWRDILQIQQQIKIRSWCCCGLLRFLFGFLFNLFLRTSSIRVTVRGFRFDSFLCRFGFNRLRLNFRFGLGN